jgi:hypothetical protein
MELTPRSCLPAAALRDQVFNVLKLLMFLLITRLVINAASPAVFLGITLRWVAAEGNMIESRTPKKQDSMTVLCEKSHSYT